MRFAFVNPNWDFTGSTYFGCRDPHIPLELMFAYDKVCEAGHEPALFDAAPIARERLLRPLFATLPGERHELGLLMSAMICASQGYKVHYLGADLPPEDIAQFAREVGAIAVAISVVVLDSAESVPAQLESLSCALGSTVPVWLGGAGTSALPLRDLPPTCVVVQDQTDLEQRLEMLAA